MSLKDHLAILVCWRCNLSIINHVVGEENHILPGYLLIFKERQLAAGASDMNNKLSKHFKSLNTASMRNVDLHCANG